MKKTKKEKNLVNINLKTPIVYYGGKQKMLRHILPLIPAHNKYVEPFCGGAAVFFAKQPATLEIINDINEEVVNFYRCCKENPLALKKRISYALHARAIHRQAVSAYKNPQNYSKIERAAAFFFCSAMCYASIIGDSFSTNVNITNTYYPLRFKNKKKLFSYHLAARFDNAIIECLDAVKLIEKYDAEDAFFYVDPPYFNASMGHYGGYAVDDFERLLTTLSKIKGKFLLSCYPSESIKKSVEKNGWNNREYASYASIKITGCKNRQRTESLTFNYDIQCEVENEVK
jgi:DNA adenine methylase